MNAGHKDNHQAEGDDLRATRRRFLLARELASQCSAGQLGRFAHCATRRYGNGALVSSRAPHSDVLTL